MFTSQTLAFEPKSYFFARFLRFWLIIFLIFIRKALLVVFFLTNNRRLLLGLRKDSLMVLTFHTQLRNRNSLWVLQKFQSFGAGPNARLARSLSFPPRRVDILGQSCQIQLDLLGFNFPARTHQLLPFEAVPDLCFGLRWLFHDSTDLHTAFLLSERLVGVDADEQTRWFNCSGV